jgi:RDD family
MNDEQDIAPLELTPQPRPVDFFAHFAGAFVDGLIVLLLIIVLIATVSAAESYAFPQKVRLPGILADLTAWAPLLLHGASEILSAGSPGKWLAQVTTRRADAAPASRWRLAVRWMLKASPLLAIGAGTAIAEIASLLTPVGPSSMTHMASIERQAFTISHALSWVVVLGTLLALLPSRRTLHDWIAGTAVFYQKDIEGTRRHVERGFEVQAAAAVVVVALNEPAIAANIAPVAPVSQNSGHADAPR